MRAAAIPLFCLMMTPGQAAAQAVAPVAPIADPGGLLPAAAKARMGEALLKFHADTGRWMAVVVGAELPEIVPADAPHGVGIVLGIGRDAGKLWLVLTDPEWVRAAPEIWPEIVADQIEIRFRGEAFSDRALHSVELLARILPDKLAFMIRPAGRLSAEAVAFSWWAMGTFGVLLVIGYLYIAYRSLFDSGLKATDDDPFSEELRRLQEQENTW